MKRSALLAFLAITLLPDPAAAQQASLQSSTQKYRERNPSAATGRSGGATLAARLLRAKDETTLVEVTTGELDSSATPLGTLSKVKLKGFDSLGEAMFTINAGPLSAGGSWNATYSTFGLGQPFEVQGNIRGVDGKRTDIVTVTASVLRRPDLEASALQAPARTRVNLPVGISATITELNGDVGARADCVLFVDGVEADRSAGIWVDSRDAVSCAFSQTFASAGSRQLKISALKVLPGDWDMANNSVEQTIEVVASMEYQWAYAAAATYKNSLTYSKYSGRYVQSNGDGNDWEQEYTYDHNHDWNYYYGYRPLAGFGTSLASVAVSATDGTTLHTFTTAASGCNAYGADNSTGRLVYWSVDACSGYLYAWAQSYAGTVTYFTSVSGRNFDSTGTTIPGSTYAFNYGGVTTFGSAGMTGLSRTSDVSVTNAAGDVVSLPVTFSLSPYSYEYSQPQYCYTHNYGTATATYCYSWSQKYDYMYGWGSAQGGGAF